MKIYLLTMSESKFYDINIEIDDVKNIASKNIENIIERGENLESLSDKAHKLETDSLVFHTKSRNFRHYIQCQYHKQNLFISLIIVVVIGIFIWILI